MQDMLFSATRRNSAWVESSAILFLRRETQACYKKYQKEKLDDVWTQIALKGDSPGMIVKCICTWAGTETDPGSVRREPGTLFCPTAGESSRGCSVQRLPGCKNTPGGQLTHTNTTQHTHKRSMSVSRCTGFETYRKFIGKLWANAAHFVFPCFWEE